ncbi:MAG: ABC-F family ATP-binding cassette domain-containing protein [Rhizobiaceae bacterium]
MLTITDLSLRIAGRLLIDNASVSLPAGAKAGFVGRNGSGKTTLFRAITGDLAAETGSISMPKGTRIGGVAQEAPGTDEALIDIVLAADTERTRLLAEADSATDAARISEIQTRLADIGAHSAEARAAAILAGLGFDHVAQKRPARSFSGGWRMRVALAAVLFSEPDLLLLDEPTNYLDLEGTLWLENYLARYPHTVLLISHDRDLLNQAVNSIIHLQGGKLTLWRGGFDQFERQYAERAELAEKTRAKQAAARKHMEAFVERFRYKASKARQAQSRLKALERLQPVAAAINEHVTPIRFPEPKKDVQSPALALRNVSVGYTPGDPVLKRLNLRIDADDRIALLGANGNGKSTFAKLIAGRLEAEAGEIIKAPNLTTAFFAQHQLDELRPAESPVQHVRRLIPQAGEAEVRSRVAQMGLATEKMDTEAQNLSGGEKARLLMGLAAFAGANLLILDEPTNHLDIDTRTTLIEALNAFSGAVILISHDRHLIEATADRLWLVADGSVAPYEGDLTEYRKLVTGGSDRSSNGAKAKISDSGKQSKSDLRKQAAQRRDALKPLAKKIKETETLMEKLRNQIQTIESELADPALYEKNPVKAGELAKKRSGLADNLEAAEHLWLEDTEAYETGMQSEG